jgi:D,D-heptose 1,7-bisphosphate phosphatase
MKTKEERRAVFLDRDGTINEEVGYVNHLSRFRFIPGVLEGLNIINKLGLLSIVITNQGGVAKGFFDEKFLKKLHTRMLSSLKKSGAIIDAIYYCPHHPHGSVKKYAVTCNCRKPATGLVEKAVKDFNISLKNSYYVGDQRRDIEFGKRLGLITILVKTGYGKGELYFKKFNSRLKPDYVAEDLYDAAKWIKRNEERL